jgi:hypothetical protein
MILIAIKKILSLKIFKSFISICKILISKKALSKPRTGIRKF